jgi:hypothetical protein
MRRLSIDKVLRDGAFDKLDHARGRGTYTVILKRTFNQPIGNGEVLKFWRIVGPIGHPNLNSDLSIEGMKEWGIIKCENKSAA